MKIKIRNSINKDKDGFLRNTPLEKFLVGINDDINDPANTSRNDLNDPTRLLKLYIEPTNQCNLGCRTCIRHTWNEPMGMISDEIFNRVIDGINTFTPKPLVFFGGFGEPLSHPKIIEMITKVKELGSRVELITNGTLLTPELSKKILNSGLDTLWVSIDGASSESYADIRLGATLPKVLENLHGFIDILKNNVAINSCGAIPKSRTSLGIAFVAMKRNISDLPAVLKLAKNLGALHFLVTNVLPYTKELCSEILYKNTLNEAPFPEPKPIVSISLMDPMESTRDPLFKAMIHANTLNWGGKHVKAVRNRCPFIESGVGVIGWDGGFSPCLSLLHDHASYYQDRKRFSRRWIIGNIGQKTLSNLWNDPKHLDFRKRVQVFDFAPCVYCGGCDLAENNEEDCQGNGFPTCGGCLWAQGVIQCP